MTITEFAKENNISYQAVAQRIKAVKDSYADVIFKDGEQLTAEGEQVLRKLYSKNAQKQTKELKASQEQITALKEKIAGLSEQLADEQAKLQAEIEKSLSDVEQLKTVHAGEMAAKAQEIQTLQQKLQAEHEQNIILSTQYGTVKTLYDNLQKELILKLPGQRKGFFETIKEAFTKHKEGKKA